MRKAEAMLCNPQASRERLALPAKTATTIAIARVAARRKEPPVTPTHTSPTNAIAIATANNNESNATYDSAYW